MKGGWRFTRGDGHGVADGLQTGSVRDNGLVSELGYGLVRPQDARLPEESPSGNGDLAGGGLGVQVGDREISVLRGAVRGQPCRAFLGQSAVPSPQPWRDRQATAALHRIVETRPRFDPRTQDYYERRIKAGETPGYRGYYRTQAYYERRTQEGKTRREIIRCLKRYAAREVFNLVEAGSSAPSL